VVVRVGLETPQLLHTFITATSPLSRYTSALKKVIPVAAIVNVIVPPVFIVDDKRVIDVIVFVLSFRLGQQVTSQR
jgi:hypothetical protein